MRACALVGKIREIFVWQSAQAWLPTNSAPSMCGAVARLTDVVEQEFRIKSVPIATIPPPIMNTRLFIAFVCYGQSFQAQRFTTPSSNSTSRAAPLQLRRRGGRSYITPRSYTPLRLRTRDQLHRIEILLATDNRINHVHARPRGGI